MKRTLLLFDVDGTLTKPRCMVTNALYNLLLQLKKEKGVSLGIVGGSDLSKQKEQLGERFMRDFEYVFSENGLVYYKNNELQHEGSFATALGEDRLQTLMNESMRHFADVRLPVKRGTFFEYRKGLLNVSPCGRGVSQEERDAFEEYDSVHHIRKKYVELMNTLFGTWDLNFAIGGQISVDIYPKGWDKTYCLQFIPDDYTIHFFGDKTDVGGNDHELYEHPRTVGHKVANPDDTMRILQDMYNL
ncbi:HAD-superfamily hydrolase, subfamily IIB [Carpediemonas membranifera]|uniref:Phosphomannomutase n=1 Tax=Carpediemonas membranifera TaxID=201153 RepID=A0A8J6AX51_9EUKA|nr:HAD-superfamily hydrolase, subfamily IIB [Carpediemonas membranifera]|eukprot:KAG9396343.1 HAD-superfamily hydrolase, subfamily IIB [Carpediemonas membranifera]